MLFPTEPASILLVSLLALTLLLVLLFALRARATPAGVFRALPGIAQLRGRMGTGAETGQPLHIATGSSGAALAAPTAETLAGLMIVQRIAEETARRGGGITATSGDIVAHTALRGTLRDAYGQAGYLDDYAVDSVQLVAQGSSVAYAAGVAARYAAERPAASAVVGGYGSEALLITEEGAAQGIPQVAAATSLAALPLLTLSADATLIGEELFAAEAYLSDRAAPKARLQTHDALRWAILAALAAGLIWQIVALNGALPTLG